MCIRDRVRGVQGVPPGRRPVEKAASVLKKGIDFGPNSCFFYVLKQFSPAFLWILPSVFLWTVCYNDVNISPPYGLCTRRAGGLLHPAFFHFCALLSGLWAIHLRIPPPGSSFVLKRRCPAEGAAAWLLYTSLHAGRRCQRRDQPLQVGDCHRKHSKQRAKAHHCCGAAPVHDATAS